VAVGLLTLGVYLIMAGTEGAAGPWHHLFYAPILVAGYLFGVPGALGVAVIAILTSGPIPVLLHPDPDHWPHVISASATLRAGMYLMVAFVTGALFDRLRRAIERWQDAVDEADQRGREGMIAVARGAEAKDTDTGDHILRVQLTSERLALATGLDRDRAVGIGWAAMLHDVGKLHVPDAILTKPGPLTSEEWQVMRMHTVWGEEILSTGAAFETARRVARWHHEDFDGAGYPDGLRGDRIPLEARIVRIADAFDAMTHPRPYQEARSIEWALDQLRAGAERRFDPELVRIFLGVMQGDPHFVRSTVQADVRLLRPWGRPLTAPQAIGAPRLGQPWSRAPGQ
jgi:hypothetical protein